jgi:hypothetical protein
MDLNSSAWMNNPNVRLGLAVFIAATPAIIADLSRGTVSWLTAFVVFTNMLTTAKAFMSDPNQGPTTKPSGSKMLGGLTPMILAGMLLFGAANAAEAGPRFRLLIAPAVVVMPAPVVVMPPPIVIIGVPPAYPLVIDPLPPIYVIRPGFTRPRSPPVRLR